MKQRRTSRKRLKFIVHVWVENPTACSGSDVHEILTDGVNPAACCDWVAVGQIDLEEATAEKTKVAKQTAPIVTTVTV